MGDPIVSGLILSCEHGGNRVPREYADCFRQAAPILGTHRGYDAGSLQLGRALARRLGAPLQTATITRLLVDLNRSQGHPRLFSEYTAGLDHAAKQAVLRRHYLPYRRRLEASIAEQVCRQGLVIHIGVHSFTPELHGRLRRADIGLLYDPGRPREQRLCQSWQSELRRGFPELRIRRNYPYQGRADGLTTALRRRFPPESYLGIELEVNQIRLDGSPASRRQLAVALADSLQRAVQAAGTNRGSP
jgi:predicted N-formylglutamate amidohydrolase